MRDDLPLLRNSERRDYQRCHWRWDRAYNEQLRPVRLLNALWLGTGIHEALAAYYPPGRKRGTHPVFTFAEWAKGEHRYQRNYDEFDEARFDDLVELGCTMLQGYVDHYRGDRHIEVIAPEQTASLVLHHPKNGRAMVRVVGTFDLVYRDHEDGRRLKLMEHKTANSISTGHLPMDGQAGMYWLLAEPALRQQGLIGPEERLEWITYNFLRKAKPDKRPRNAQGLCLNQDGSVSKVQPPPLFQRVPVLRTPAQRLKLARDLVALSWEMEKRRRGELPVLKTPTRDCPWDCAFNGICEIDEMGNPYAELLDGLQFYQGDPYEGYRKSTDE